MAHLYSNIKLIRGLHGMTQNEFAAKIGVTKDMLYTYEKGIANPSNLTVTRIAEIAGVNSEALETKKLKETDIKIVSRQDGNKAPDMFNYANTTGHQPQVALPPGTDRLLAEKDDTIKRLEADKAWLQVQLEKLMGTNGTQSS